MTTAPANSRIKRSKCWRRSKSKCVSGSSSNTKSGRNAKQPANAVILRCPPLKTVVGNSSASASKPRLSNKLRASPATPEPPQCSHCSSKAACFSNTRLINFMLATTAGELNSASQAAISASSFAKSVRAASTVWSGVRASPGTCCGRYTTRKPRRVVTVPLVGSSKPARILRMVDLPAPFAPTRPIRAPS